MPTKFRFRRHVVSHQPQTVESVQLTIKKAVTERVGCAHFRPKRPSKALAFGCKKFNDLKHLPQ